MGFLSWIGLLALIACVAVPVLYLTWCANGGRLP